VCGVCVVGVCVCGVCGVWCVCFRHRIVQKAYKTAEIRMLATQIMRKPDIEYTA